MFLRRVGSTVFVFVALLALFAGCGGDDDEGSSDTTAADVGDDETTTTAEDGDDGGSGDFECPVDASAVSDAVGFEMAESDDSGDDGSCSFEAVDAAAHIGANVQIGVSDFGGGDAEFAAVREGVEGTLGETEDLDLGDAGFIVDAGLVVQANVLFDGNILNVTFAAVGDEDSANAKDAVISLAEQIVG